MGSDTLSESIAVPEPAAFAAEMVTLKVPAATLGVPEMRPLVVLMERPPGRPVALKEVGELSAVIW
jgi:ornithine cyclodeaminase/alanine dehydrogenase-like protein (mu-crystallin family)